MPAKTQTDSEERKKKAEEYRKENQARLQYRIPLSISLGLVSNDNSEIGTYFYVSGYRLKNSMVYIGRLEAEGDNVTAVLEVASSNGLTSLYKVKVKQGRNKFNETQGIRIPAESIIRVKLEAPGLQRFIAEDVHFSANMIT